jgi:enoyl-CoA hydratase/carnithine racemase
MGWGRASEFALSGRLVLADEALQSGLVDRVVEPEVLVGVAIEVAASMGQNPSPQLRMTKQLLTENGSDTDLAAVQARESALLRECWASTEHAEAVQAFLEKRRPVFPPRPA